MRLYEDNFWGRVKEQADRKGLSLKALADKAGANYRTMTNSIGLGTVPKKAGVLASFAETLGCSVEYLVNGGAADQDEAAETLTADELKLIRHFRTLGDARKAAVLDIVGCLDQVEELEARYSNETHD